MVTWKRVEIFFKKKGGGGSDTLIGQRWHGLINVGKVVKVDLTKQISYCKRLDLQIFRIIN